MRYSEFMERNNPKQERTSKQKVEDLQEILDEELEEGSDAPVVQFSRQEQADLKHIIDEFKTYQPAFQHEIEDELEAMGYHGNDMYRMLEYISQHIKF